MDFLQTKRRSSDVKYLLIKEWYGVVKSDFGDAFFL